MPKTSILLLLLALFQSTSLFASEDYAIFLGHNVMRGQITTWQMRTNIPNPINGQIYSVTIYSSSGRIPPMGAQVVYHGSDQSYEVLTGQVLLGGEGASGGAPTPTSSGYIYFREQKGLPDSVPAGPMPSDDDPSVSREVPDGWQKPGDVKNPSDPTPGQRYFFDVLGQVGNAAANGAFMGALVHGVILTPSVERELAKRQAAYEAAAQAAAAQERALHDDLAVFNARMARQLEQIAQAPTISQPPVSVGGEFGQPSLFDQSETGQRVARVRSRLSGFNPPSATAKGFKNVALVAADTAQATFEEGNIDQSKRLAKVAEMFGDLAFALHPVTAVAKDGFEAMTGRHALTGRELTTFERTLSAVGFAAGLATGGVASSLLDGIEMSGKLIIRYARTAEPVLQEMQSLTKFGTSLGLRTAQGVNEFVAFSRRTLGNEIGAVGNVADFAKQMQKTQLGTWTKSFDIRRIHTAEEVNAAFLKEFPTLKPTIKPGTPVFDLVLKNDETFMRLHSAGNPRGAWVTRLEAIDKSLTPAELRLKYALPATPEFISEVKIPKGVLIQRSRVNAILGGNQGAIQYQILDSLENMGIRFGNPVRLQDFLKAKP